MHFANTGVKIVFFTGYKLCEKGFQGQNKTEIANNHYIEEHTDETKMKYRRASFFFGQLSEMC